jgi:Histidine kinase
MSLPYSANPKVQTAIDLLGKFDIAPNDVAPSFYRFYLRYQPETPPPLFDANAGYWTWLTLAWSGVIGVLLMALAFMLVQLSGDLNNRFFPITPLAQAVIWTFAGFGGWMTVSALRESVKKDRIAMSLPAWDVFDANWQPPLAQIRDRAIPERFWLWSLHGKITVVYGEVLGAATCGVLAYFIPEKVSGVGAAVALTYAVICIVALERSAKGRRLAANPFWWEMSNGFWMGFLGFAVTWTIVAPSFLVKVDPSLFIYVLAVVLLHVMDAYSFFNQRSLAMRMERAEQARQLAEVRLNTLKAQIEPHFIFNTIAHLKSMIANDPKSAERMADELSDFLRASLQALRSESSTVAVEMELARAYLELAKFRMGSRLSSHIHIGADAANVKMPPLLVQTLLENAIQHGVEPKSAPSEIHVSANVIQGDKSGVENSARLLVRVVDTGVGFAQSQENGAGGSGIGLANIRERLQSAYDGRATFKLSANTPSGVVAEIELPVVR